MLQRVNAFINASHTSGRSTGALWLDIRLEDGNRTVRSDRLTFGVPADFHCHNDCIAAAAMTLIGDRAERVQFNFAISSRCADIITSYYAATEVGPVDTGLEPRQRGREIGLMLSGGIDSLAVWMILSDALGRGNFKVITTDFGHGFSFERRGFQALRRDITCSTDFRAKGYAEHGRFTGAAPLLHADYLDLDAVVTGHLYNHPPVSFEPLLGQPPRYLREDLPFLAGGLGEIHLARALSSVLPLQVVMQGDPTLLEACWHGSSRPGTDKQFKKSLMFRRMYAKLGLTCPEWIANVPNPRRQLDVLGNPASIPTLLYLIHHFGVDALRPNYHDLAMHDLTLCDGMTFEFFEHYNPSITAFLPHSLQRGVLQALNSYGIEPYTEYDWIEFAYMRVLTEAALAGGRRLGRNPDDSAIPPFEAWRETYPGP